MVIKGTATLVTGGTLIRQRLTAIRHPTRIRTRRSGATRSQGVAWPEGLAPAMSW